MSTFNFSDFGKLVNARTRQEFKQEHMNNPKFYAYLDSLSEDELDRYIDKVDKRNESIQDYLKSYLKQ